MPADDTPDWNRKYTCAKRVQGYCHASNIRSYCTRNGEFRSNAMDTCGSFCQYVNPSSFQLLFKPLGFG